MSAVKRSRWTECLLQKGWRSAKRARASAPARRDTALAYIVDRNLNDFWRNDVEELIDEGAAAITDGKMTGRDRLAATLEASPTSGFVTDFLPRRELTPPDEVFLAETAREIRCHCHHIHCEFLEIGRLLVEVRKRVAHGQWTPWLQREFPWSESRALKLMQTYEAFGSNPERVTGLKLAASSLYLMAAPHTPPEARDEVMRRAEAGEEVSRAEVQRIIQEEKAKLGPKEQRRAPSEAPARRKLARPGPDAVDEENLWISWGEGAPIGAALNEFGDLVSGGDAGSLFGTLEFAIRAADEGTRGKVLAALELLGRLDEALRANPP